MSKKSATSKQRDKPLHRSVDCWTRKSTADCTERPNRQDPPPNTSKFRRYPKKQTRFTDKGGDRWFILEIPHRLFVLLWNVRLPPHHNRLIKCTYVVIHICASMSSSFFACFFLSFFWAANTTESRRTEGRNSDRFILSETRFTYLEFVVYMRFANPLSTRPCTHITREKGGGPGRVSSTKI